MLTLGLLGVHVFFFCWVLIAVNWLPESIIEVKLETFKLNR